MRRNRASDAPLLSRLARDSGGNTLAMMAIALVPTIGIAGSAIDTARLYYVQVRLQQACDSGALAGRRFMDGTTFGDLAREQAGAMFASNFRDGMFGATGTRFVPTKSSDSQVRGVATTTVPMTVARLLGVADVALRAQCEAKLEIPNLDVMFVLDTTGSMANKAKDSDPTSKITALRGAVADFHTALEGAKRTGTQIRYGFVPYATGVNVGLLLRREWLADRWRYQSRVADGYRTYREDGKWRYRPYWQYRQVEWDVAGFKGSGVTVSGGQVRYPTASSNAQTPNNQTVAWTGTNACVEERAVDTLKDYANASQAAIIASIDRVPDGDAATQWGPALAPIVYVRREVNNYTTATIRTDENYRRMTGYHSCPSAARRLAPIDAAALKTYLDGLEVEGFTYHDIGMQWGARLLSKEGLFAADNRTTPSGGEISRHLIFMTDGGTDTRREQYDAFGLSAIDRRRTYGLPSNAQQNTIVADHTLALCRAVRAKQITVWVIAFGTGLTPMLSNCASSGRAYHAADAAALNATFASIATQIAKLRLAQ